MGDYKYIRQYCEEDNDLRIRGGEIDSAKVFEALFGREPEPDEDQNMASALIDARRCFSPWHEDLLRAEFGQDTILVEEFRKQSKSSSRSPPILSAKTTLILCMLCWLFYPLRLEEMR